VTLAREQYNADSPKYSPFCLTLGNIFAKTNFLFPGSKNASQRIPKPNIPEV
jgi:hypothetical protein